MTARDVVVSAAQAGATIVNHVLAELLRVPDRPPRDAWQIGADARWLRPPGGPAIDLARRGPLRRILDALARRRIDAPGVASSASELGDVGWPGDRSSHESRMMRVYAAIRRLRTLGLGAVLVTRDDGYLIDPAVAFERRH
jgi:hypothetical protein